MVLATICINDCSQHRIKQPSAWTWHTRLREMYSLGVRRRVECKLAKLMFKTFNGLVPPWAYLSDECQPWTKTQLGDRSFAIVGPGLWNTLLASLLLWIINTVALIFNCNQIVIGWNLMEFFVVVRTSSSSQSNILKWPKQLMLLQGPLYWRGRNEWKKKVSFRVKQFRSSGGTSTPWACS